MRTGSATRFRVLWITSWYPYPEKPVAGIFVCEHARAVQLYDDITLMHLLERQQTIRPLWKIEEIHPGIKEHFTGIRIRARQSALPWTTFPIHILSALAGAKRLIHKAEKYDLVHAHTYRAGVPAALISRWLKVPMILTEHDSIFPRHALNRLNHLKAAFAFRSAQCVLPVSTYLKHAIEQNGFKPRFQVVGNTYDPEIFYPPVQKTMRDYVQITFVNNLIPLKGLELVIQALANGSHQLPEWRMQVIGGGPERAYLEALVNQLGLSHQITFLGVATKTTIAELLRRSDLFILSSLHETFSAATLEALACGVPVLATACGGPEDFVKPNMGILVQPGNQRAIELGLVEIISTLNNYNRREIAREIREKFSYEAIGAQIHDIYASILSR